MAYTAYHNGDLERADSAFASAIPRLTRSVRARFDDISPVASERDTFLLHRMSDGEQGEFVRRFWKSLDPDLVTRVNEALLEYRARVAQAYFLFYNPKSREWDERGEVYVRYGAPGKIVYNPVGMALVSKVLDGRASAGGQFPANFQVWEYPELGMKVTLEDRTLSEYYMLPATMDHDPDPIPDPDSLALRQDQPASPSLRGVFPRFAPGVVPMPVRGTIARFESDARPQFLAQVEVEGAPADSQWLEWVVIDTTTRELRRGTRMLAPSACDPSELRVGDVLEALDPGRYTIGVSVRDRRGRRGLFREEVELESAPARLAASDIVISCGAPYVGASGTAVSVRPEPNPSARVEGRNPLTAYFEIYHLRSDRDGLSRFEYVYTVKSAERDPRIWLQRAFAPKKIPIRSRRPAARSNSVRSAASS